jgi:hypothetical protein
VFDFLCPPGILKAPCSARAWTLVFYVRQPNSIMRAVVLTHVTGKLKSMILFPSSIPWGRQLMWLAPACLPAIKKLFFDMSTRSSLPAPYPALNLQLEVVKFYYWILSMWARYTPSVTCYKSLLKILIFHSWNFNFFNLFVCFEIFKLNTSKRWMSVNICRARSRTFFMPSLIRVKATKHKDAKTCYTYSDLNVSKLCKRINAKEETI